MTPEPSEEEDESVPSQLDSQVSDDEGNLGYGEEGEMEMQPDDFSAESGEEDLEDDDD